MKIIMVWLEFVSFKSKKWVSNWKIDDKSLLTLLMDFDKGITYIDNNQVIWNICIYIYMRHQLLMISSKIILMTPYVANLFIS